MDAHALIAFFQGQPVITLFLLLGFGYLVGRIKVAGFAFGPVAGTLLVSLALGHLGFRISPGAQAVGFALFIFSIGYQAGPRFLEVLRSQGTRYFALALFVAVIGFVITWAAGKLLSLPPGANAGLFAGGFTSSPMLAAAQQAARSGLIALPAGWTADRVVASIGTSYAIAYVVGTIGVIALISVLPKLIGLDLEAESRRLDAATTNPEALEPLQARAYRVENDEFCRPTIAELAARLWDGFSAVRIRRDLAWLKFGAGDHLRKGDEIYAYGYANFFRAGIDRVGPEIRILDETELSATWTHVVVVRHSAIGQTLRDLNLARQYGLVVSQVMRDGHALPVTSGPAARTGRYLDRVGSDLGHQGASRDAGAGRIECDRDRHDDLFLWDRAGGGRWADVDDHCGGSALAWDGRRIAACGCGRGLAQ